MRIEPALLFDLHGTLAYQHVLAWKEALDQEGIELAVWRIHRKIGMSGGLFTNQLLRETGLDISVERVDRLRRRHAAAYRKYAGEVRPLPGARELLARLSDAQIPSAIATSGLMETAGLNLATLGVDPQRTPVVSATRSNTQSPIRICSWRRPRGSMRRSKPRSWLATASGTCWRRRAAARSPSDCSVAGRLMSCSNRARFGSTRIWPTCCFVSTRSRGGGDRLSMDHK